MISNKKFIVIFVEVFTLQKFYQSLTRH